MVEEIYRLFDRRCRTETALAKLARLRAQRPPLQGIGPIFQKLQSPNLEKALTFLDDSLLGSTSNAVERGNRRHRKMQKTVYRVRTQPTHQRPDRAGHVSRRPRSLSHGNDEDTSPRQATIIPGGGAKVSNSGGPLFDACGNVVGIVTAKTIATTAVDSYGIAVAAEVLDGFLSSHLSDKVYRSWPPLSQRYDWAALDRLVSPSVVHVVTDP